MKYFLKGIWILVFRGIYITLALPFAVVYILIGVPIYFIYLLGKDEMQ